MKEKKKEESLISHESVKKIQTSKITTCKALVQSLGNQNHVIIFIRFK